jgi:hypothetical protein
MAVVARHWLEGCSVDSADVVVLAAWGNDVAATLHGVASEYAAQVIDVRAGLGDALAAAPALAWVAALDLLTRHKQYDAGRAVIINAGIDGGIGLVILQAVS